MSRNLVGNLYGRSSIKSAYLQYTPSVSTIKLSGPTYSSQNVWQIWESTLSKSDYLVGHLVGRKSGY
jgi:hypothetical protein